MLEGPPPSPSPTRPSKPNALCVLVFWTPGLRLPLARLLLSHGQLSTHQPTGNSQFSISTQQHPTSKDAPSTPTNGLLRGRVQEHLAAHGQCAQSTR